MDAHAPRKRQHFFDTQKRCVGRESFFDMLREFIATVESYMQAFLPGMCDLKHKDFLNLQDPPFLWKWELDWKRCRARDRCAAETRHKQRSHQWTDGRTDGRPHALPCAGFDHTPKSILPKEYPSLRAKLRKDNPTVPVTKRLWSCLKHCHSCSHCVSHPSQGQKLEGETGQAGDPPIQEGAP
ncbi:uncharacterized protein LOC124863188 isoform X5 [Girardinichthys multiradiatus]|uniref:uncharacterized protein LOC124863188 isoform X5 n=1 Tax=Girardinichthys multiradiatus TaxID=208333 RepID=UPI001FAB8DFE|nr:uncharacterized protein LOC124863188 isoform X5 [Girardinichthys multiradiatus]